VTQPVSLRAEGISHRFGALEVLAGIDLAIRPGEVTVLLGPSGCGKSTLLAILGGLLQPERGRVVMEGTPPAGCLNPLTYVFQDFALLPWRRVAANVSLVLEGRLPKPEREARIAEVLALTGLSDFAQAWPRQRRSSRSGSSMPPAITSRTAPCSSSTKATSPAVPASRAAEAASSSPKGGVPAVARGIGSRREAIGTRW